MQNLLETEDETVTSTRFKPLLKNYLSLCKKVKHPELDF
jgi:hypothetical protein